MRKKLLIIFTNFLLMEIMLKVPTYKGLVRNHDYWIVGVFIFWMIIAYINQTPLLLIVLQIEWFIIMLDSYKRD